MHAKTLFQKILFHVNSVDMKIQLTYISDTQSEVSNPDKVFPVFNGCCGDFNLEVLGIEAWGDPNIVSFDYTLQGNGVQVNTFSVELDPERMVFNLTVCGAGFTSNAALILKADGVVFATIYISNIIQFVEGSIETNIEDINFGTVLVGNELILSVILTNNSTNDIDIDPVFTGLCTGISFVDAADFTIPAGDSYEFFVKFAPLADGIDLSCLIGFNVAGLEQTCPLAQIGVLGKSLDDCTIPATEVINPSDCVEESELPSQGGDQATPFTELHTAFASFYNCADVSLVEMNTKLKSSGFFGLMDKSKKAANHINDVHYFAFYLYIMWLEKVEDALAACECCRFSKHPKYYIDKYKLDCIADYFRCRNIDITCWLKAFHVETVFFLHHLQRTADRTFTWNLNFGAAEQFADCPDTGASVCCIEGNAVYTSDWIYEHLKNYAACPSEPTGCLPFTANESEEQEFYTGSINELYNCDQTYTRNLNESICD